MLFKRIQDGIFSFPDREWAHISDDAKDMICNLLKRDPRRRYSAREVLDHTWISNPVPNTLLATPRVLSRFVTYLASPQMVWVSPEMVGVCWYECSRLKVHRANKRVGRDVNAA